MSNCTSVPDELEFRDADGARFKRYDDVVLLRTLKPTGKGNCSVAPSEIPAGTRATAILLLDVTKGLFYLECYLGEHEFAFAEETAEHLRLLIRAEDKHCEEAK